MLFHSKGVAVGAHGVRGRRDYPTVISYAVSVQGGDHTSVPSEHPYLGESRFTFYDSTVMYAFNSYFLWGEDLINFLNSVTGWDVSVNEWENEMLKRILDVQRVLLLLGGPDVTWDPSRDDDLPPRFYEPLPSGPCKGLKSQRRKSRKRRRNTMSAWDGMKTAFR